jgi:hypothetical protein
MEGVNPKEKNRDRFLELFVRPRGLENEVAEVFAREIERIHSFSYKEQKNNSIILPSLKKESLTNGFY